MFFVVFFLGKKCTIPWNILHIILIKICKFLITRKYDAFVAKIVNTRFTKIFMAIFAFEDSVPPCFCFVLLKLMNVTAGTFRVPQKVGPKLTTPINFHLRREIRIETFKSQFWWFWSRRSTEREIVELKNKHCQRHQQPAEKLQGLGTHKLCLVKHVSFCQFSANFLSIPDSFHQLPSISVENREFPIKIEKLTPKLNKFSPSNFSQTEKKNVENQKYLGTSEVRCVTAGGSLRFLPVV